MAFEAALQEAEFLRTYRFTLVWDNDQEKVCMVQSNGLPKLQKLFNLAKIHFDCNRDPRLYCAQGLQRYSIKSDDDLIALFKSGILVDLIYVKPHKNYQITLVWDSGSRDKACAGNFAQFPTMKELTNLVQFHFRPETESWPILYVKSGQRRYFIKTDEDLYALRELQLLPRCEISVKFRKPKAPVKKSFFKRF